MTDRIPDRRERLYADALESWGEEAQMNKAAEEFAEAAATLNRALNGQAHPDDILAELADARLMLEQMEYTLFDDADVDRTVAEARLDLVKRIELHGGDDE